MYVSTDHRQFRAHNSSQSYSIRGQKKSLPVTKQWDATMELVLYCAVGTDPHLSDFIQCLVSHQDI